MGIMSGINGDAMFLHLAIAILSFDMKTRIGVFAGGQILDISPNIQIYLDDRKSLLMAFLVTLDQYETFFFHKMAAGGHFG